jgi:hypothetical protein
VAQATPQLEDPWVFGHAAPSMSIRAKGRANSRHYASASDDADTPGASGGSDESAAPTGSPNADDGRVYGCPTSAALTPDLIRSGPDAAAWKRRSVASSFGLAAFFYLTYWFAQMYTPRLTKLLPEAPNTDRPSPGPSSTPSYAPSPVPSPFPTPAPTATSMPTSILPGLLAHYSFDAVSTPSGE